MDEKPKTEFGAESTGNLQLRGLFTFVFERNTSTEDDYQVSWRIDLYRNLPVWTRNFWTALNKSLL